MIKRPLNLLIILLYAVCTACATNGHLVDEYQEVVSRPTSGKTVVLFLIDGMAISTLQAQFADGQLPNIQRYFGGARGRFYMAYTTFPSLTYPAIASLLTEKPTHQNGLYGNIILAGGKPLSFEKPSNLDKVNRMIEGNNIFSRLKRKGLKTVSLDFAFHADSDAHLKTKDVKIGYAIHDKNYGYVDGYILNSFDRLLKETAPEFWPDFIFVHLVGLDFLSHDHGPQSAEVIQYLKTLDKKIGVIVSRLEQVEKDKRRNVMALMTSDHGFDQQVAWSVNLEPILSKVKNYITVLNEGRFLSLHFKEWQSLVPLTAKMLARIPGIELVAYRNGNHISIDSHSSKSVNYPFFNSNLANYFQTPGHPDVIVIPKPGVSFKTGSLGQHGGPTTQEVLVPLLIRNGTLSDPRSIPALWELLRFM